MTDVSISDPLMQMIFSAVEEGINALTTEQGLVPFVLFLTKEGVVLRRFADDDLTVAIEQAQQAITQADDDTLGYALVYDGQIEIASQASDALMIEAGERGKSDGWRFVQRYQAKINNIPTRPIGDIAYIGLHKNHIV